MPVPASSVRRPRHAVAALAAGLLLALAIEQAVALPLPLDSGASALLVATPDHLVLSEVMTGGTSASDEFIELYNPTLVTQPLEGLEVVYVTSTGATVTRKATWAAGAAGLPSGAHLLVANSAGIFAGIADLTYANGLAATGGSVALRLVGAAAAIDAVGWGTAASTWLETRPAPAPAAGSSLERLPGGPSGSGQDTDDNLVDFVSQPVPDPQNSTSPPISMATPTPTPTPSATPGATSLPTETATPVETASAPETPSPSPIDTPSPTSLPTETPSPIPSPTPTPTPTPTPSPTPTPTPTPTPSPISIAEARGLPDGTPVLVEGVALTDGDFTDGGGYLTDGSAGIAVLLDDGSFARGQLLRVAGIVDDRYAQRTIRSSLAQVTILGVSGEPLPVDSDTGTIGEAVEGQLVELTGVIASAATTLSAGVAWDVDDGSGPVRVVIGTSSGIDTAGWGRGVGLTLVGVVGQRDSSGSGTTGYRVQPRDLTDLLAVEPAATPTPTPTPAATPTAEPTPMPTPTASPIATPSGQPSASPTATAGALPLVAIEEARAATTGTRLRIRGVVTAQSGLLEPGSAVVQDATGAILVRLGTRAGSLSLGQFVELDGTRATKAGMLSLRVSQPPIRLGTQPDPVPLRRATGALGEGDEARLVITRGVVTGTVSRSRSGAVSLAINDGSGPVRVTISPQTGIATASIRRGAWIEVRGVLGQETTARAPLAGYRLWPRIRADVAVVASPVAVAGAAGSAPCCISHGPAATPIAAGSAATGPDGAGPGARVPPILARPFPTSLGVPPITVARPSIAGGDSPRAAGVVVSGMGLAALAGLAAWLGRRRRPDDPDPAEEAGPATLDQAVPGDVPRLSLVRIGEEEAEEERRILPPT